MLTGLATAEDKVDGFHASGDDYLVRHFDLGLRGPHTSFAETKLKLLHGDLL